jgi:hypothetical protein
LNNHGYQNLLDFTIEKLIITHSKYESEGQNTPSIYCEDIATAFGCELPEIYIYPTAERQEINTNKNNKKMVLFKNENYSLTELAIYKLCPHLYYHSRKSVPLIYKDSFQLKLYFQNIVFSDVINQFSEYSAEYKKIYSIYDDEALNILLNMLPQTIEKHLPLFSFISKHEMSDTVLYIHKMVVDFVCYDIINKNESGYFSTEPITPQQIPCNGYLLNLEYDMLIKLGEKTDNKSNKIFPNDRAHQLKLLIDFLTLYSKQEKGEFLQHYADMMHALSINDPKQDRIKLIARMVNKINAQFSSGSERFKKDGIVRTDGIIAEIENTDFLSVKLPTSEYCRYCKINEICKGFCLNMRGDSYANR